MSCEQPRPVNNELLKTRNDRGWVAGRVGVIAGAISVDTTSVRSATSIMAQ